MQLAMCDRQHMTRDLHELEASAQSLESWRYCLLIIVISTIKLQLAHIELIDLLMEDVLYFYNAADLTRPRPYVYMIIVFDICDTYM